MQVCLTKKLETVDDKITVTTPDGKWTLDIIFQIHTDHKVCGEIIRVEKKSVIQKIECTENE